VILRTTAPYNFTRFVCFIFA